MQRKIVTTTIVGIMATSIALLLLLAMGIVNRSPWTAGRLALGDWKNAAGQRRQSFEDFHAVAQRFADELGQCKEQKQTISPAELAQQADAENTYPILTLADPGEKLDPETLYARAKPGVVVVGGIFKCTKCQRWHVQCASGFVVRPNGLILTNMHVVDSLKKLDAMGVMTDDGRVFPVKAVLAANRLNDLALLKVDAENLQPLPVADDVSTGAAVYCVSHPILASGKTNCFYTFSQGIVCGKFTLHNDKEQSLKVLAVTAEYGPGSSGGPILNEHGAVVAMACQAIPQSPRDLEKGAQMVWKFSRPSCSIQALLSASAERREPAVGKSSSGSSRADAEAPPPVSPRETKKPSASRAETASAAGAVTFELHPQDQIAAGYYRPVAVQLAEEPPVKPKSEPAYRSKKPLYGVLRLGDAEDNRLLVVVDEPEDGPSKIYIDRKGDGDLANAGPGHWDRDAGNSLFAGNVMIDVPYRTGKIPYKFSFYRFKNRMKDRLFYYRNSGREGEVVLDGNRYRVLVLDDNADGRFDDLKNGSLDHRLESGRQIGGDAGFGRVFLACRAVQRAWKSVGSRLRVARRPSHHVAEVEGRRAHQALPESWLSGPGVRRPRAGRQDDRPEGRGEREQVRFVGLLGLLVRSVPRRVSDDATRVCPLQRLRLDDHRGESRLAIVSGGRRRRSGQARLSASV